MSTFQGRFVWYELMTTDAPAAAAFYRDVVGWGSRDSGMPGVDYTLLTAGDAPVAGMMALSQAACDAGARPGWIGYVAVDDVDAAVAQVRQAGGAVHHEPTDIPGVGRFAVVADPHGAVLGLLKGTGSPGPEAAAPGTQGHYEWRELMAADREAAFAFYAGLFGWTKAEAHDMGAMGVYQLFAAGGTRAGGMMTKPEAVPAPYWLYYVNVHGIDAAIGRVTGGGGRIVTGPHQVPGDAWIVQCLDPQGALFALVGSR